MTAEIIAFRDRSGDPKVEPERARPDARVVAILKELLAEAEAGRIDGVAFSTHNVNGSGTWGWSGAMSTSTLCLLTQTKFSIARQMSAYDKSKT